MERLHDPVRDGARQFGVAAHRGAASIVPILVLIAFGAAITGAAALGAVSTITAVSLGTGANVYVGMRMLARRLHGERPSLDLLLLAGTLILGALASWRVMGHDSNPLLGAGIATVACALFAAFAIGDTRRSIVYLATSVR